jgi:hypothetical protein
MAAPNLKSLEQRLDKLTEASAKPEPACVFQMADKSIYRMTTKQFFDACQFAIQGGENQYTHIILNATRSSGIGRLAVLLKMVVEE